jgi:hypothetical protein
VSAIVQDLLEWNGRLPDVYIDRDLQFTDQWRVIADYGNTFHCLASCAHHEDAEVIVFAINAAIA